MIVTLEIHTPFFINAFNCNITVEFRNYLQLKVNIEYTIKMEFESYECNWVRYRSKLLFLVLL